MDLVAWARLEAERRLSPLGDRWAHTQGVVDRARALASTVPPADSELLIAAAYLHDIGYAPDVEDTGFHPLDGARWLRAQGQERLACLVAYHSGAWFEARARGLRRRAGGVRRGALGRGGPADVLRPHDRSGRSRGHAIRATGGDRATVRATTATSRAGCAPPPDRSRRSWRRAEHRHRPRRLRRSRCEGRFAPARRLEEVPCRR